MIFTPQFSSRASNSKLNSTFQNIHNILPLSVLVATLFCGVVSSSSMQINNVKNAVPAFHFSAASIKTLRSCGNPNHHSSFSLSRATVTSAPSTATASTCRISSTQLRNSFQDGSIEVTREYTIKDQDGKPSSLIQTSQHSLHYRIHNRMNLSSQKAAPILVLHGGPGVPSDYLYPLKDVVPYRSIVFYDQLGSGRSPGPDHINAYSIEKSIDDLEFLLKKLNLRRFHLYGQSFGGILAFEYLKRKAERSTSFNDDYECLSVILSSAPPNVEQVEDSANKLIKSLLEEDDDQSTLAERFRINNQCRLEEKPQSLVDAYDHAGTLWRGTTVIQDWKAEKPIDGSSRMPSALVLRGEHDFVSDECCQGWKDVFNHKFVRFKVLRDCSHHGLLENGLAYGDIVDSFFSEYD